MRPNLDEPKPAAPSADPEEEARRLARSAERSFRRTLVSTVLGGVLCVLCFVGTSWAWYSGNVTSGVHTARGAHFTVMPTLTSYSPGGGTQSPGGGQKGLRSAGDRGGSGSAEVGEAVSVIIGYCPAEDSLPILQVEWEPLAQVPGLDVLETSRDVAALCLELSYNDATDEPEGWETVEAYSRYFWREDWLSEWTEVDAAAYDAAETGLKGESVDVRSSKSFSIPIRISFSRGDYGFFDELEEELSCTFHRWEYGPVQLTEDLTPPPKEEDPETPAEGGDA